MTINKSQGQNMYVCDLNLCTPSFSHGQLYVAYSQVGKPSSLIVISNDYKADVTSGKIPLLVAWLKQYDWLKYKMFHEQAKCYVKRAWHNHSIQRANDFISIMNGMKTDVYQMILFKQLSICLRHVFYENNQPALIDNFVGFIALDKLDAESIAYKILLSLENWALNLNKNFFTPTAAPSLTKLCTTGWSESHKELKKCYENFLFIIEALEYLKGNDCDVLNANEQIKKLIKHISNDKIRSDDIFLSVMDDSFYGYLLDNVIEEGLIWYSIWSEKETRDNTDFLELLDESKFLPSITNCILIAILPFHQLLVVLKDHL
ncbi:ATP-dependent DNA helicase PIF1-like, partial [Aphis craccivora]